MNRSWSLAPDWLLYFLYFFAFHFLRWDWRVAMSFFPDVPDVPDVPEPFLKKFLASSSVSWLVGGSSSYRVITELFFFKYWKRQSVGKGLPGFNRVLPSFTEFDWVFLRFTGSERVSHSFTEFYRVSPRFMWLHWALLGFYRVLPSFTEFYRVIT